MSEKRNPDYKGRCSECAFFKATDRNLGKCWQMELTAQNVSSGNWCGAFVRIEEDPFKKNEAMK